MCYGPEFIAINLREWRGRIGAKTLYIEPGKSVENGYCESLNSKLPDELLNGEIFATLREAEVVIENCANTTTPSGRTPRQTVDRQRQKQSCRQYRSALRSALASPDAG